MSIRNRILSSFLLFLALVVIFRANALATRCPAISCDVPTGCVGACYSYINAVPFVMIAIVSIVLPVMLFRLYIKFKYQ